MYSLAMAVATTAKASARKKVEASLWQCTKRHGIVIRAHTRSPIETRMKKNVRSKFLTTREANIRNEMKQNIDDDDDEIY